MHVHIVLVVHELAIEMSLMHAIAPKSPYFYRSFAEGRGGARARRRDKMFNFRYK
jgi:hypothetical protein